MNAKRKQGAARTPRVTTTKGVRLTEDELAHFRTLLPQYPECASEAELLRQATLIGLYVLAAQAGGQPAYGGYRPSDLIALLKYRVLPAINFLFEHEAFPALYHMRPATSMADAVSDPAGDTMGTQIVADAADELGDLGTNFMDD